MSQWYKLKKHALVDPITPSTGLPNEVVHKIFEPLSCQDLAVAARVSHEWYDAVLRLSNLLGEPEFSEGLDVSEFARYLETCHRMGVRHVRRMWFSSFSRECDSFEMLFTSALEVESMRISTHADLNFGGLRGNYGSLYSLDVTYAPSNYTDFGALLAHLPQLESLSLTVMNDLSTEAMYGMPDIVVKDLRTFRLAFSNEMDKCPYSFTLFFLRKCQISGVEKVTLSGIDLPAGALKHVIQSGQPSWMRLEDARLSCESLVEALNVCPCPPSTLQLSGLSHDITRQWADLDFVFSWHHHGLSALRSLHIGPMNHVPWLVFSHMLDDTAGSLEELAFTFNEDILCDAQFSFAAIFQKCPNLQALHIVNCGLTDCQCRSLGEALAAVESPKLQTLHLSCERISDIGIGTVFRRAMPPALVLVNSRISDSLVADIASRCKLTVVERGFTKCRDPFEYLE